MSVRRLSHALRSVVTAFKNSKLTKSKKVQYMAGQEHGKGLENKQGRSQKRGMRGQGPRAEPGKGHGRAVNRPSATGLRPAPALFFKTAPAPASFFSRTSFPVFRILNFTGTIFKADIINNLRRDPTLGAQAHAPFHYVRTLPAARLYLKYYCIFLVLFLIPDQTFN